METQLVDSSDTGVKRRKIDGSLAADASLIELVMTNPITLPVAIQGNAVSMAASHVQGTNLVAVANNPITITKPLNMINKSSDHIANGNGLTNRISPLPNNHCNNTSNHDSAKEQRDRVIAVDHCKAEQIALLTALSQVVSCTQEAIKILRESQERSLDLEHKRFRFQLEAEEKRLMMESEHYRKIENMFSGLIQAISQTPTPAANSTNTVTPIDPLQSDQSQTSPSVKVEVDT